jgi:hypothetical protein
VNTPAGEAADWPLDFVTPDGVRVTVKVTTASERRSADGLFLVRDLVSKTGLRLVQKVVVDDPDDVGGQALLRAIRAGVCLHRRFGNGHDHPAELEQLTGYDVDVAERFALFEPGADATAEVSAYRNPAQFAGGDHIAFLAGMIQALRLLEAAGLVHQSLGERTVRWTNKSVRITDFSRAAHVGEPGYQVRPPDWRARPRRDGSRADPRDDVFDAALLLCRTALGRPPRIATAPSSDEIVSAGLERVGAMFAERRADRPLPHQLLTTVGLPDPVTDGGDPRFEHGRAEFVRVLRRKWPDGSDLPDADQPRGSSRWRRR